MKQISILILWLLGCALMAGNPSMGNFTPRKTALFKAVIGKSWSLDSAYCIGTAGMCSIDLRSGEDSLPEAGMGKGEMQFTESNRLEVKFYKSAVPGDLQVQYFQSEHYVLPDLTALPPSLMHALGRSGEVYLIQPGSYSIVETPDSFIITF
ncbi:MAG: hypothetical protein JNK89_08520 [Saprospiraceae bacterium]|nr:hypothetical protein [Saprospiraceae bacterium]